MTQRIHCLHHELFICADVFLHILLKGLGLFHFVCHNLLCVSAAGVFACDIVSNFLFSHLKGAVKSQMKGSTALQANCFVI